MNIREAQLTLGKYEGWYVIDHLSGQVLLQDMNEKTSITTNQANYYSADYDTNRRSLDNVFNKLQRDIQRKFGLASFEFAATVTHGSFLLNNGMYESAAIFFAEKIKNLNNE
jgi:hypothetical protein